MKGMCSHALEVGFSNRWPSQCSPSVGRFGVENLCAKLVPQAISKWILYQIVNQGVTPIGVRMTCSDVYVVRPRGQRLIRLSMTSAEFSAAESLVLKRQEAVLESCAETSVLA